MSKMSDFYTKVIADEKLREKVAAVLGDKAVEDASDDELKKIGEVAREAGFDVTLDEAKAYIKSDAKDLSDEALDAVAGGVNKGKVICKGENAGVRTILVPEKK